jgi:prepilin-type N-terminal cleavage/methylation domain-containing protein
MRIVPSFGFRVPGFASAARIREPGTLRRLGFTIIEIMLAIGIFAMVLTAIYATWIAILKGSKSGLKAAAEVQRARIAMRTLEDAFNSTEMFVANMKYYLFVADTSGDTAAVSLASRLPAGFPGVGRYGDQVVRRVSFYTQPGKDGMSELIMTQAPILLATNDGVEAYTITLARDVTLFKLAFFDDKKNEWLDEWKYTNQLPRLVQIALGLGKTGNDASKPYDLSYSLVALPSVAIQGDIQGGAGPILPGAGGIPTLPVPGQGGLRGSQFNPNNPSQFQNPNQNLNTDPRFNRGGQIKPGGGFGR